MKTKLFLLSMAGLISQNVFAQSGNGAGNGGVAIVCRNQQGAITSAKLLDHYNGELLEGLKYENASMSESAVLNRTKERFLATYSFFFLDYYVEELKTVQANWKLLPKGTTVVPANDAELAVVPHQGCKAEYTVNYVVRTGQPYVLVNSDIYEALNPLEQASLKVHEAVYAATRKVWSNEQNSVRAQDITAIVTADEVFENLYPRFENLVGSPVTLYSILDAKVTLRLKKDLVFKKGGIDVCQIGDFKVIVWGLSTSFGNQEVLSTGAEYTPYPVLVNGLKVHFHKVNGLQVQFESKGRAAASLDEIYQCITQTFDIIYNP